MRGLILRRVGDDRGAVVVIVAVLAAFGVLVGLSAVSIDVGRVYAKRAELQTSADSGALALATECAKKGANCVSGGNPTGYVSGFVGLNAVDAGSTVDASFGGVCGSTGSGLLTLPACPPASTALFSCAAGPPAGTRYVEVHTSTAAGGLPRWLAAGQSTVVRACSRATWGGVGSATGLALTLSVCEWNAATSNGTVYAAPPPYPPNAVPPAGAERKIVLHQTGSPAVACTPPVAGPAGWDLPGGFGWLDDSANTCQTTVDAGGIYHDNTGVSVSSACRDALDTAITGRQIVYIPVYDGNGGTGHNGYYHLLGFAAFVPTGYVMPGGGGPPKRKSWLTSTFCDAGLPSNTKCLSGYFTQGLIPAASGGGPDLGASVVSLSG
ncbi:MAG: Tad domain-containing protein [Motilibacteraceae bacterium]